MSKRIAAVALLAGVIATGCGETLDAQAGKLSLSPVGNFKQPLQVEDTGGGVIWVVEKGGKVIALKNRQKQGTVIDLSNQISTGGEQGLLGVAVSPNFKSDGKAYLYLTNRQGDSELREYQGNAQKLNPQSGRVMLKVNQPEDNHNGGTLRFGPDGMLYLGLGDGGGSGDQHGALGNAQDKQSLLGKILRIDPNGSPYKIPKDNPYAQGGGRPEIWALGLRNPWRMSFDQKGRLWIGDVGESQYEEISRIGKDQAGANLGWRVFEGNSLFAPGERAAGAIKPVITYSHKGGRCSVVGGVLSRSKALKGRYLYGDTCDGRLRYLQQGKERNTGLAVPSLVSIDQDQAGEVYLSGLSGKVYQLKTG